VLYLSFFAFELSLITKNSHKMVRADFSLVLVYFLLKQERVRSF